MSGFESFLENEELDAYLMVSESTHNADMYYLTRFIAPDPFAYLRTRDQEVIVVSQMEYGRAQKESKIEVRSGLDYSMVEKIKKAGDARKGYCEFLLEILKKEGATRIAVPPDFPIYIGDELRSGGVEVHPKGGLIESKRMIKTPDEVILIKKAQRACEEAMQMAIDTIRQANVKDGYLFSSDEVLTAEKVKARITYRLLELGCEIDDLIVAAGRQAADPHCSGSGPLMVNEPVVIDIFPRLKRERYYADMSRTVSYGEPSRELKEMYDAVSFAQEKAIEMIRSEVKCAEVHNAVCDVFEERGYGTIREGDTVGFIHSTGHGVGLDIHEKPSIADNDYELSAGNVITIEPGLYYPEIGGIRIEDLIIVKKDGYENLTNFGKDMVI